MKKRLLTMLLIICLVLALVPAYALADGEPEDPTPETKSVLVTFNPQGGMVTVPSMMTNDEGRLEILPTPFRKGYTFIGWHTPIGLRVTCYYIFTEETTVYARWQLIGGDIPVGTANVISIPGADHGEVVSSCETAASGAPITLTVTPKNGYELESLKVTDRIGKEVKLTKLGEGEYSFNMPDSNVTVRASFSKIDGEAPPVQPGLPFTDVPSGSWYHNAVFYVYEKGLMKGVSESSFSPGAEASRAMVVTILYRLEGAHTVGEAQFTDVAAGQWYTDAVAWASANGIVYGYSDVFRPDEGITREQAASILYRYAEYRGKDTSARADLSGYSDVSDISDYALEAMQWANAQGIIRGSDGRLSPGNRADRAEIAAILMRFCGN